MNAQELFIKATEDLGCLPTNVYKKANIFYCEKCRIVHREKNLAEECCLPRKCKCGEDCEKYYFECPSCVQKTREKLEREKFDKAEKIDIKDYKGYILNDEWAHDDWGMYFDNYFENHDLACPECGGKTKEKDCPDIKDQNFLECEECKFKTHCFESCNEIYYLFAPEYIWAANFKPLEIDYENLMDSILEDHHESVGDYYKGMQELKIAIDKFNEINKNVGSYEESRSVALINIKSFVQKLYA